MKPNLDNISKSPVIQQLMALGYQVGDTVCGRNIPPKEIAGNDGLRKSLYLSKAVDWIGVLTDSNIRITPLKWTPTNILKPDGTPKCELVPGTIFENGLSWLKQENDRGYGIYFHPNGGRTKASVTRVYSAFFESDEGSFDEQWAIINDFSTQTTIVPSVVVKTRKSLHVYYAFDDSSRQIEGWTDDIQRPLCLAMKSDPAIQNLDRLMRLAGFNHVKWVDGKFDFIPCTLEVCDSSRVYSRNQITEAIAQVSPQPYSSQRFKLWVYLSSPSHKTIGLNLDPEIARTCTESELDETERRWRHFIKLSRLKAKGKNTDPQSAFKISLSKLPKTHKIYDGEVFESSKDSLIWAQYCYGYNPIGRGDWVTLQDPTIPESDRLKHSIDSVHIHKESGAIVSHRGTDVKEILSAMKALAKDGSWKKLTTLSITPDITVNQQELDLESLDLKPGEIYIIQSAKGTGKTNSIISLMPKYDNVYAIFARIALGREACEKLGIDWDEDASSFLGGQKRGFCVNSAYKYPPTALKKKGLYFGDEFDQVMAHTFGETCNKDGIRPTILKIYEAHLAAALTGGGNAIFMSADISDKEVEYIKKTAPKGTKINLIVNFYRRTLGNLYFDESPTLDALLEEVIAQLKAGKNVFIIDDVKGGVKGCRSIAEYIRKRLPEIANQIVEVNSDTSGSTEITKYLKNINTTSKHTRLLICSPSVISGISITNNHFDSVFGFNNGILATNDMCQALIRVRGCPNIYVWAAQTGFTTVANGSFFPEQIKAFYQRNYAENQKYLQSFEPKYDVLTDEWNSPHFELYCQNAAYQNLSMADLRVRLKEKLIEEGYNVITTSTTEPNTDLKNDLKRTWHELEIADAKAIADANILTDNELKEFEVKKPTPEERLDIQKTWLLKNYGQPLIDAMVFSHKNGEILTGFAAMALKDQGGKYKKQLDSLYLLMSDKDKATIKDLAAEDQQLNHDEGRFAGDIRWYALQRKERIDLGIKKFLDNPDKWYIPSDLEEIALKAKRKHKKYKDALNVDFSKMKPAQIYVTCLEQLGLSVEVHLLPRNADGDRIRQRRIATDSWFYAQLYLEFRNPKPPSTPLNVGSPLPIYSYTNNRGGDPLILHTGHTFEGDEPAKKIAPDFDSIYANNPATQKTMSDNRGISSTGADCPSAGFPIDKEIESVLSLESSAPLDHLSDDAVLELSWQIFNCQSAREFSKIISKLSESAVKRVLKAIGDRPKERIRGWGYAIT